MEDIMNQFFDGMSNDIRFQLQYYKGTNLEDLFKQAVNIEHNIEMKSIVMEDILPSETYHGIDQVLRTKPFEEGENDEDLKPVSQQIEPQMMINTKLEPFGRIRHEIMSKYKGDHSFNLWSRSHLVSIQQLGELNKKIKAFITKDIWKSRH